MTDENITDRHSGVSYSVRLANDSYEWYKTAAIRSRKAYRMAEIGILALSASIPVTAAISPHNAITAAILGAIVVVISGVSTLFHWQDNYLRFSGAREAVEAERRLYYTETKPYDDPVTREQILAAAVSRIEQDEMATWIRIARRRPKAD
jgi:hypothetical protein